MKRSEVNAGELRHRLAIQSKTNSVTAHGSFTENWSTDDTVYGAVLPLTGKEFFADDSVESNVSHRIVIRYYSGLTASQRFLWGSRAFNIVAVLNTEERNRKMLVMCLEVTT